MTLNDPLINDLKESIKPLLSIDLITDENKHVFRFCESVEKIFHSSMSLREDRIPSPWVWMNAVACEMDRGNLKRIFPFVRSVETTRACQKVTTDTGKFRQLVRCCLKFKCLHVPVEVMVREIGERTRTWYQPTSVLGHEVLGEILISVLLQASHLNFQLDINNARFLDWSWLLPVNKEITFVPCETLGLIVTYHRDLAVIVALKKGSVAAEENNVEPGDVLDELNGQVVTVNISGKLKGILSKCKHQPITIRVVKTHAVHPTQAYAPCVNIYRKHAELCKLCTPYDADSTTRGNSRDIKYIGCCSVGSRGDVTVVESGIRTVVTDALEPRTVRIECRELDIRVHAGNEVLMKHSYVNIASCAHSTKFSRHFAYIVGNGPCSLSNAYTCHVFSSESYAVCASTLLDISAGFERTHCAA